MKKHQIFDRNLKARREIPVNSFYFLFSEIVQYCIKQNPNDLEKQLEEIGYPLGSRFLELITLREQNSTKEIRFVYFLLFIKNHVWPILFNKSDCTVEMHEHNKYIYMIKEQNTLCNRFACLPKGQRHLNCSAFTAGIIEGMLNAAGFSARVSALFESENSKPDVFVEKTVYLIHFAPEVIERDEEMAPIRS